MVPRTEHRKTNPDDFGGIQTYVMTVSELSDRMCVSAGCGRPGVLQIAIASGGDEYRILCGVHAVLQVLLTNALIGDPAPAAEAREFAVEVGVDWAEIVDSEPVIAISPERWRCTCGGRMERYEEADPILASNKLVAFTHICGMENQS